MTKEHLLEILAGTLFLVFAFISFFIEGDWVLLLTFLLVVVLYWEREPLRRKAREEGGFIHHVFLRRHGLIKEDKVITFMDKYNSLDKETFFKKVERGEIFDETV